MLKACEKKPDEKTPDEKTRLGRIDIAVYYPTKPKKPRQLIEVKKINTRTSLDKDLGRVLDLMKLCEIADGVLIGYCTRAKKSTMGNLFKDMESNLRAACKGEYKDWRVKLKREKEIDDVQGKKAVRNLYAAVYSVRWPIKKRK